MAKVQDVGAVVIYANDPALLSGWYRVHLGIELQHSAGGCYHAFFTNPENGSQTPFGIMPAKTNILPHSRAVMVNYCVDNLDSFVKELEQKGILIEDRSDGEYGKFAHLRDAEGNPIELWQKQAG